MATPQSISEPRRNTLVLGAFDVVVLCAVDPDGPGHQPIGADVLTPMQNIRGIVR